MYVVVLVLDFDTNLLPCRWDTRSSLDPKLKVQAHDAEVMAVAFSPAVDHLVLTGSSDKV
jgi:WD40 repeat protein